jgi:peptidoglycan-N-acetylglucosamine deacetylase
MMVGFMGGTALATAGVLGYAVRGRSSRLFGPSVWRGPRDRRAVALTFDDGPSESTPELLELLAQNGARATFFQVGANVRRLPAVAREVADAGHQTGNHSDSHARLYFRSPQFIYREIARAQDSISAAIGRPPVLFRAPYGARWFGLNKTQAQLGLLGVMWTAIGLDWKLPADAIAERLLRRVRNGAILCLHDGRELQARPDTRATIEAVRRIIPELRSRGFGLETVSELICSKN